MGGGQFFFFFESGLMFSGPTLRTSPTEPGSVRSLTYLRNKLYSQDSGASTLRPESGAGDISVEVRVADTP